MSKQNQVFQTLIQHSPCVNVGENLAYDFFSSANNIINIRGLFSSVVLAGEKLVSSDRMMSGHFDTLDKLICKNLV